MIINKNKSELIQYIRSRLNQDILENTEIYFILSSNITQKSRLASVSLFSFESDDDILRQIDEAIIGSDFPATTIEFGSISFNLVDRRDIKRYRYGKMNFYGVILDLIKDTTSDLVTIEQGDGISQVYLDSNLEFMSDLRGFIETSEITILSIDNKYLIIKNDERKN